MPTTVGVGDSPATSGSASAIAFHQAPDQATLHFVITTLGVTCDNPGQGSTSTDGACPVGWDVTFALPAASQVPGVYSLSDPAFQSGATQSLGDAPGGGCMGGGGGGIEGTKVEILSVDAGTIKVRLSGFNSNGDLPQADGDYDVSRCM